MTNAIPGLMQKSHPTATVSNAQLPFFARIANSVARATGRPITFVICCIVIVLWAVSGPFFHYSDTWQLIINTGTTIVTFLMVFLIQNTQNREGIALQAKLDELIRATKSANNIMVAAEQLSEEAVIELKRHIEEASRKPERA
ncbi:MAG TPA: low affinity iron permease family protein [Alphaproteobacteria bacterium]|nr:low affinity iron permease family protein [Alphaproteobacteria bacterium]